MTKTEKMAGIVECPVCGEKMAYDAFECPHCGHVARRRHRSVGMGVCLIMLSLGMLPLIERMPMLVILGFMIFGWGCLELEPDTVKEPRGRE